MYEDEYDDLESIPSEVRHLFVEKDGKYVLIGASEMKTSDDVSRVQESLRKEREDHKVTKGKLSAFNGLDPEDVHSKLDRIDELEAAAGGNIDDNKINEMVESRIKSRVAPLERQINSLTQEKTELEASVTEYQGKERTRSIHDTLRAAAVAAKVRDTAVEDVLLIGERLFETTDDNRVVTRDGVGVTPGLDAEVWLTECKNTRTHWFPESQGVGATGGKGTQSGNNPFSAEGWNLTEQGKMVTTNRDRAEQMARAAGTTIGGKRPEK